MGSRLLETCAGLTALTLACAPAALAVTAVFSGARVEADGRLELQHVERVERGNPAQRPQGRLRLRLGLEPFPRVRLQGDLTGTAGGTPRDSRGAGVFDFDHVKQDISPSLEADEAYVEWSSKLVDLRVGLQRFAWGRLDGIQPNDLLNPEKFYDPLLEDEEDRKVGIPALAPTLHFPRWPGLPSDLRLTGVWAPIVIPYHFPDEDERWYPPLARVPPESRVMGLTVRNEARFANRSLPRRSLANGTLAARLQGRLGGADFALYYFDGFDTAPILDAAARGFVRLDPLNPQLFDVRSEVEIFPVFERIRSAGADLAVNVFGVTLRAEGAYVLDRAYPRAIRDIVGNQQLGAIDPALLLTGQEQEVPVTLGPATVRRDGVEWGVGGDTLFSDGTFLLFQVNQTIVLDNDVDLLQSDTETRLAMTLRKSFLDERLRAEVIGVYGVQGVYGMGHPRLTYSVSDHLDLRVGYLLIEGREGSFLGQYKKNDEAYVRARVLF